MATRPQSRPVSRVPSTRSVDAQQIEHAEQTRRLQFLTAYLGSGVVFSWLAMHFYSVAQKPGGACFEAASWQIEPTRLAAMAVGSTWYSLGGLLSGHLETFLVTAPAGLMVAAATLLAWRRNTWSAWSLAVLALAVDRFMAALAMISAC